MIVPIKSFHFNQARAYEYNGSTNPITVELLQEEQYRILIIISLQLFALYIIIMAVAMHLETHRYVPTIRQHGALKNCASPSTPEFTNEAGRLQKFNGTI